MCVFKIRLIQLIVIVFCGQFSSLVVAEGISFGLKTKIWPHMWVGGKPLEISKLSAKNERKWRVSTESLDIYQGIGAQWNIVTFRYGDDVDRIDRVVDEHKIRGIDIVLRIVEKPEIYDELSDEENSEWGYNKEYYEWITLVTKKFKNKVKLFFIGNEVEQNLFHNFFNRKRNGEKKTIEYLQYKKVINTAYKAVKNINKDFPIADGSVGSFSLGLAVCVDIYNEKGLDAAFKFWKEFQYGRGYYDKNKIRFLRLMTKTDMQTRAAFVKSMFTDPGNADFFQIHHYRNWTVLPDILDWVKARVKESGVDRPIIASEIGYKILFKPGTGKTVDWSSYSEDEHAEYMIKDYAILFGAGIKDVLYWQIRWHHGNLQTASLYSSTAAPSIMEPYKAAFAYKFIVKNLTGAEYVDSKIIDQKGITEFNFKSESDVSIVWTDDKVKHIAADKLAGFKGIFDMYGEKIIKEKDGSVPVKNYPIYLIR